MTCGDVEKPGIVLSAVRDEQVPSIEGRFEIRIGADSIPVSVVVPAGPVGIGDLLPIFRGLADLMAGRAEDRALAAGRQTSCRAGCGACCRQAVPISASEARDIARMIETMPEPRQSTIRERFSRAREKLTDAGLRHDATGLAARDGIAFGLAWFGLGMACPFLEDESCSIHAVRPLACREYLVTSPAANCAAPSQQGIDLLPLEASFSRALRAIEADEGWTILALALDFTDEMTKEPARCPAPGILGDLLARL